MPVGTEDVGVGLAPAEVGEPEEDEEGAESDSPFLEEQAARMGRAVASPAKVSADRRL
jgi:hypothetical protein